MKTLHLPYAEIYITNVCNLTCDGCNRFNRYAFKGWQSWSDWKDIYQKWGQELHIDCISIMGGEPMLNPDFYQWVQGISLIWPTSMLGIASNGTRLHLYHKLYSILLDNRLIVLKISMHNKMHKKELIKKVEDFLTRPLRYQFDSTRYRESLSITDVNNVTVKVEHNWWFHQGAIVTDEDSGKLRLHQSDPIKAHDICHSKTCHHFDKGRLYKCGPAALFPEFDKQFALDLTESDRQLMLSVPSIGIDDTVEQKIRFVQQIDEPIPQCKFCPEEYYGKQIFAMIKKK